MIRKPNGQACAALALSLALTAIGGYAQAQDSAAYPAQQPINLVVGYPAGGSVDLNARLLGEALAKKLGQKVVVENLGGVGGVIAASKVVKAKPDGYTLLVGSINEIVIAGLVNPNVKYDGIKDFRAIGLIGTQPLLLAASRKSAITDADGYMKMVATGKSGNFNFGSSGVGTSLHLAGEMINTASKGKVQHIPYKGVAPLVTDMVSGQLDFGMFGLSSGLPQIKAGLIVPIGVTSSKRSLIAPEIPALAENPNFKDIDINLWFGLFGPRGLPDPVAATLRKALSEIVQDPAFQEKYKSTGGVVTEQQPAVPDFFIAEQKKLKQIVDTAGIGLK